MPTKKAKETRSLLERFGDQQPVTTPEPAKDEDVKLKPSGFGTHDDKAPASNE